MEEGQRRRNVRTAGSEGGDRNRTLKMLKWRMEVDI